MRLTALSIVLSFAAGAGISGCSSEEEGKGSREGTLILQSLTSGELVDLDGDGYQVTGLPGGPVSIGVNDAVTVRLEPGPYVLILTGLAGNCTTATAQEGLTVDDGRQVVAHWDVSCSVVPGQATVAFDRGSSTGVGSIEIQLNFRQPVTLAAGEMTVLGDLAPGGYTVTVTNSTPNCRVTNATSQPLTIVRNQQTVVTFTGYCSQGILAFDENVATSKIYVMNADSSGLHDISGPAVDGGRYPALSPDGTLITYVTGADSLMMMGRDGANQRLITQVLNVQSPVWSPEGDQIAFSAAPGIAYEVYVVDTSGANLVNTTNDPAVDQGPSWSPDGRRIVFASDRSGTMEVYSVAPNGTGLDTLTSAGGYQPAWSPDQHSIAFVIPGYQVWMMNQDGTNPHSLTDFFGGSLSELAWSPDGRFVAFYQDGVGLVYAPVDGLNPISIFRPGGPASYRVSWGP
ncbi:MAG: hypothetical protein ABI836_14085 [Gemmatimonadota bacterium]